MAFDGTSVWVTNNTANTVVRIVAITGGVSPTVETTYSTGTGAFGVISNGTNVWVSNRGSAGATEQQWAVQLHKMVGPNVTYNNTSSGSFALQSITVSGANCGLGSGPGTTCQMSNAGLARNSGGLESPVFPQVDRKTYPQSYTTCQADDQVQSGGSISYVDDLKTYLLVFVCDSPENPMNLNDHTHGAALFYSTNPNLSNEGVWPAPQEIEGTWAALNGCSYDEWYPTLMSVGSRLGHLSMTGYIFTMKGCLDQGAGTARQYTSRGFLMNQ
jgi:hypothetical protein